MVRRIRFSSAPSYTDNLSDWLNSNSVKACNAVLHEHNQDPSSVAMSWIELDISQLNCPDNIGTVFLIKMQEVQNS